MTGRAGKLPVLVVTKGHAFDHDRFLAMFDAIPDVEPTLVQQPAAQVLLQPEHVGAYRAVLFYDMSGVPGIGLTHDGAGPGGEPPERLLGAMQSLLGRGTGLVLLNHATVSWPAWPLWRQITGSSFLLRQGELNGRTVPGSGYRGAHGPLPNATFRVAPHVHGQGHPVLDGLAEGFTLTDELYLKTGAFGPNVVPLLRAEYDFVAENFTAPPLASAAERADWHHPPGTDVVAWANAAGYSPVVATDLGDGPEAYDNPGFRTLVGNALRWVASVEARAWAVAQGNR
jgi:uncharacterized protein